jgi:uracil-DNA glycosylase
MLFALTVQNIQQSRRIACRLPQLVTSLTLRMQSITSFFKANPSPPTSGVKRPRDADGATVNSNSKTSATTLAADIDHAVPVPSLPESTAVGFASEITASLCDGAAGAGVISSDASLVQPPTSSGGTTLPAASDDAAAIAELESMGIHVHPSWVPIIISEVRKPYFRTLHAFLTDARKRKTVFPPPERVFTTFQLTPFADIKVVILGQDPYHGANQAHGLSFSVPKGVPFPPSLRNILKEAQDDVKIKPPKHGCLENWAKQGVVLLNAVLTVDSGNANSHADKGWELFTSAIIKAISDKRSGVVFLLWGKPAQVSN